MKTIALLTVALTATVCVAQTHGEMTKGTGKKIACAVMKRSKVDIAAATKKKMFADYKGNRYFFCCDGCPQAFKKNPAKFVKAPHILTPKAK